MNHRFAPVLVMVAFVSFALVSCGESADETLSSDPAVRPFLERALRQSLRDSAALATGRFQAEATMRMELRQEDGGVRVIDSLLLVRDSADYSAEQRSHRVEGDTSLLKNMYAFEDAKGAPRAGERARLASLDFGTSFPTLLRSLLAGEEGTGFEPIDGDTVVAGEICSCVRYRTVAKSGLFCVDTGTLALVRLEVRQQSNYVVGSYDYRARIDFQRHAGLLLPVKTVSTFDYRRVFTEGTGIIAVLLQEISVSDDSTETPKQ